MRYRDTKEANVLEKMAPIYKLHTELSQNLFVKNTVSVKYNKAKHKKQGMPVICFQFNSQAAATEPKRSRRQALSCLPDFTRHSR